MIKRNKTISTDQNIGNASKSEGEQLPITNKQQNAYIYNSPETNKSNTSKLLLTSDALQTNIKEERETKISFASIARPRLLRCKICRRTFLKCDDYKKHMIAHHSSELPYQCDLCGNCFRIKKYIRRHMKQHRLKQRKNKQATLRSVICSICSKRCYNLNNHMMKHSDHRAFSCDICKATFKTKHHLAGHMPIHINARQYKCPLCPKDFNFKTQFTRHLRVHSTTCPYVCHICGTGFKFSCSLSTHMRSHTGEKPYGCDRCDRAFSTSVSLRVHIRIHTGDKPYVCDICGRGFADGSTMKIHKRIHTGENPYICHLCGKTTKQASNLKSHYRHYHKITDITSKTIRSNARIFEKHRNDIADHSDFSEILSRAATAEAANKIEIPELPLDQLMASIQSDGNGKKPGRPKSKRSIAKMERKEAEQLELKFLFEDDLSNSSIGHETVTLCNQQFDVTPVAMHALVQLPMPPPPLNEPLIDTENYNYNHIFIKSENVESETISPDHNGIDIKKEIIEYVTPIDTEPIVPVQLDTPHPVKKRQSSKLPQTVKPEIEEITINKDTEAHSSGVKKEEEFVDVFSWFKKESHSEIEFSAEQLTPLKVTNKKKPVRNRKPKAVAVTVNSEEFDTAEQSNTLADSSVQPKMETIAERGQITKPKKGKRYQICPTCGRKYKNHDEHMSTHSLDRPFECDICHKTFRLKDYLKLHRKLHTEEKNIICHECGAAFYYNTDLTRHMRSHSNERPHRCELCDKTFKETCALRTHMRSHTGEKPYNCTVCDKSFSTSMGQRLHIRTHTGEKPYKCDFCNSQFADNSTFRQHVRIHTGERPYKCHICGKGTTQAGNLKSHYRHYHKLIVKNVVKTASSSGLL